MGVGLDVSSLTQPDRRLLELAIRRVAHAAEGEGATGVGRGPREYYRLRCRVEPGWSRPSLILAAAVGLGGFVLRWLRAPGAWSAWAWLLPFGVLLAGFWLGRRWRLREPRPVLRIDEQGVWLLRKEPTPRLLLAAGNVDRVLWGGRSMAVKRRDGTTLRLDLKRLWSGDREDVEARIRAFVGE
jgi:hypothetical protein